jgi:hypothetical protein
MMATYELQHLDLEDALSASVAENIDLRRAMKPTPTARAAKPRTVRARIAWLGCKEALQFDESTVLSCTPQSPSAVRVIVIPDDPASREAMVDKIAEAIDNTGDWSFGQYPGGVTQADLARAALGSLHPALRSK